MPKSIKTSLAGLFLDGQKPGQVIDFTWLLIRRRNRPFLLLPVAANGVRVGLELYSAQRRRAKVWRTALPLLLRTPAAAIFQRIRFGADPNSEIIRFLCEQSGLPAEQLPTPAIKFGGQADQKSRFVLLTCDASNRPVKVIKVGVDANGRAVTEREADLLEKLPANTLGCIRMTGRLTTPNLSAFATSYFPGDSPDDDSGMEILFHSWINPEPAVPIESLDAWHDLETKVAGAAPGAWRTLRAALAGRKIRGTLYHGDFAPWNIRAVNSQNLQVFDWEGGNLRGVPGWDWLHFIVQTSILARRNSVERVAAEVEELLQSPRFQKYAEATGIAPIVKPLMLAYLLRQRWVIQPLEGGRKTTDLYELLAGHWEFAPQPPVLLAGPPASRPAPVLAAADSMSSWADARTQLISAWSQLANVFWEPTLTANLQPSFYSQLRAGWPVALFCCLWLAAVANFQYFFLNHLLLLPIYAIPCLLATWKMGRRWGMLFAAVTAGIAPLVAAAKDPGYDNGPLICWNSLMRFLSLQICVFLADRVHRHRDSFRLLATPSHRAANIAANWAVVLASAGLFVAVVVGDFITGPRVIFLPLYLFPAMLLTLFLNLRCGAFMALLAAIAGSVDEYWGNTDPNPLAVFRWNPVMRFLIFFFVILPLDRLSQENILFPSGKQNGSFKSDCPR
jgi:hypothetical protein